MGLWGPLAIINQNKDKHKKIKKVPREPQPCSAYPQQHVTYTASDGDSR